MTELATLDLLREGRVVRANLSGELDLANTPEIQARLLAAVSNEDQVLILDLGGLSYIDSAGLRLLFELAARLRQHEQGLHVVIPREAQPWRTLQIVGAASTMPIHESLEEATAAIEDGKTE